MKTASALLTVVLLLAAAAAAPAQTLLDRSHVLGVGVQTAFPYDELGDEADTGYGAHAVLDYPLIPLLDATARVGWTSFAGTGSRESVDVWEISAGGRLALGTFYMGGEVGWFDRGEQWTWVPSIGLRFSRLEVALRWVSVGRNAYTGVSAAWYF